MTLMAVAYGVISLWRTVLFCRQQQPASSDYHPPVTVLKPLCGDEPGLEENLHSFCTQDYPEYQVIFGVRQADDPAVEIIQCVIEAFPERDLTLVIDDRIIGTNYKVSNLSNMAREAKHDIIAVVDSDMRVDAHYLEAIAAPFQDQQIGFVTCLYKGVPAGNPASVLGAMYINTTFMPSVLVALAFQELRFTFGATMAVRRQALEAIGGFEVLADQLADDYMLGKLATEQGYKGHLSPYVVEDVLLEPDLKALLKHELRWARTVRTVRPLGYMFSFLTNPVALSGLFLLIAPWKAVGLVLFVLSVALRFWLHYTVYTRLRIPSLASVWWVPVRDVLSFLVWMASFFGKNVLWKDHNFLVKPTGDMTINKRTT